MNKAQVVSKIEENKLTEQDKIEIFNWYLTECRFPLNRMKITTALSPKAKQQLEYSVKRIKEYLGLTPTIHKVNKQ